jgi:hypothetical protein
MLPRLAMEPHGRVPVRVEGDGRGRRHFDECHNRVLSSGMGERAGAWTEHYILKRKSMFAGPLTGSVVEVDREVFRRPVDWGKLTDDSRRREERRRG